MQPGSPPPLPPPPRSAPAIYTTCSNIMKFRALHFANREFMCFVLCAGYTAIISSNNKDWFKNQCVFCEVGTEFNIACISHFRWVYVCRFEVVAVAVNRIKQSVSPVRARCLHSSISTSCLLVTPATLMLFCNSSPHSTLDNV